MSATSDSSKKRLAFLLAVLIFASVHEGMHALMASLYGEYEAFRITPIGFEVLYKTPVEQRGGMHWALIAGAGNLVTILMGYLLLLMGESLSRLQSSFLRAAVFYLTLILLLVDPLNLSVGPFVYGGDANGIASGLGINRTIVQSIFLVVFFVNRELVAQKLFPVYKVQGQPVLLRPLIPRA